eukprot:GFUD01043445.1.p1 GENE.GFUD01043445.1~~GFUD01043445.1.p1  ORF type:complete len:203 (+),score=56.13 GFUD01043445.1:261-869(+)
MVNFIYHKEMAWSGCTLNFLSSLYFLAEKYDIKNLKSKIISSILEKKIIKEDVLEVATLAEAKKQSPELSEALYDIATLCLQADFKGRFEAVLDFFSHNEGTETNAVAIYNIMARMNKVNSLKSPKCENCCQSPCLNRQGVTRDNFVPGARVTWVEDKGHSQIDRLMSIQDDSAQQFVGSLMDGSCCKNLTLKPTHYLYNCL